MAGLAPAIHVLFASVKERRGCPAQGRASRIFRTVLSDYIEQLAKEARSIAYRGDVTAQPCVEAEAATGGMERKHKHHDREEYILPWPLGGSAGPINAEPQVQHENDSKRADESDPDAENERHGKGELGKEDDGIKNIEVRKIDRSYQLAMKFERGPIGHLFGPVLQAPRHRQRQLP